ncbi:paxneb protein [Colletotrichum truncatum]|uniref:Paxneb protein n=1 Tax=Colletotrichum truncatum TaxID=5467 RepID=A0ACC3YM98_COLTU|nr:paxneb protein [Colletotrichum truncatum]KAF6792301.1 paxneb protein [Colletotrichum truncatum]
MSFRKKNVVLGSSAGGLVREPVAQRQVTSSPPGTRPSPLDGRLTTSTGTASLDQLLAGHAGLPLGCCLLIEESGTTDFSGILLKYYAAEGLVQGHQVHVLGPTEAWRGELPGLSKTSGSDGIQSKLVSGEKMKIAWRYESLGSSKTSKETSQGGGGTSSNFCHSFDLAKRLQISDIKGDLHVTASMPVTTWFQSPPGHPAPSPLEAFIAHLSAKIKTSAPGTVHRVLVPNLLSPTLYGPSVCRPADALQFLHMLRVLLRQNSGNLSAIISLSTSLYPRTAGLTRWMELLCDGVLEMLPLHRKVHLQPNTKSEDIIQGILKIHSLPIYHEKGGGPEGQSSRENLSFRLSSSSGIVFRPYTLPPLLDGEDHKELKETRSNGEKLDF